MDPAQLRIHRVQEFKSRKSQRCRPLAKVGKDVYAQSFLVAAGVHSHTVSLGPEVSMCIYERTKVFHFVA